MYILGICSDPALAKVLSIIKNALSFFQIVVPILLVIAGSVELAKMVINPDDQKGMKSVVNSFMAAITVFMLPITVNLVMTMISTTGDFGISNNGGTTAFDISACWVDANNVADEMDSANDNNVSTISKEKEKNRSKLP